MKKLKFCMVTTFYPPYNFGGDGIFVQRLVNALARRGHTIHVIHNIDAFALQSKRLPNPVPPEYPNITIHALSDMGKPDLLLSHQLGRPVGKYNQIQAILEQTDFDVIHFHNISLLGGPDILQYGNAIKICTLHDHWFVCAMHVLWRFDREICQERTCLRCTLTGKRPPQLWRYTNSVANATRHVDIFIAPSHFACRSHLANGFPAAISYLPHFLPVPESKTIVNDHSFTSHPKPYFLFVGRLEKIKGVQALLEQFRSYHAADLLIAGSGIYEAELQQMAQGLAHVHFLGKVDYVHLQELYHRAIAVIIPSLCYETFGLVAIEAFAVGTPAIVHDLGALPETVQTGGGLIYQTPEELLSAMEALRTQSQLRRQLGEQSYRIFLETYTEEKHVQQYYKLIQEVNPRGRSSQNETTSKIQGS
jgi:glycosyltransferase involved in cell wall biosynthesis